MPSTWAVGILSLALLVTAHPGTHEGGKFQIPDWEPTLGQFAFNISTPVKEAQRLFSVGLLLLYNFDQQNARSAFSAALSEDPTCALCAWGVAHSHGPYLNHPAISADAMVLGRSAAVHAADLVSSQGRRSYSAKELVLVDAMLVRYPEDPHKDDQLEFYRRYADRLRQLRNQSASLLADADLMVFDAEAMMVLLCDDHGYHFYQSRGDELPPVEREETMEASALLRKALVATNQTHPYAQHLLIHSTEMSNTEAETAVQVAAQLYRNMKGLQNNHLQHMTSHTFLRTGHYHAAIEANMDATRSDASFMHHGLLPYGPGHNSVFLVCCAMWGGERAVAYKYAQVAQEIFRDSPGRPDGPDGSAAWSHPMMVAVRFGDWKKVMELDVLPPGNFSVQWPYGYGVERSFSLAVAAVRQKRVEESQAHLIQLRELMREVSTGQNGLLTNLSLIANHTASAVVARAIGNIAGSLEALQKAVEIEMGMPYDEPPTWVLPTRECYGQALMHAGRFAEAEQNFRQSLYGYSFHAEPNCGWAMHGLRQSLQKQGGHEAEIQNLTQQMLEAWRHSDVPLTSPCLLLGDADEDLDQDAAAFIISSPAQLV